MRTKLLVISADAMVGEDLTYMSQLPNYKRYFEGGCGVTRVRSIYPTLTYPAHVSITTGCYPERHKIINNLVFEINRKNETWEWDARRIAGKDIFHIAKSLGYTTGAALWPVSGSHPEIDYLVNEYWINNPERESLISAFRNNGSCDAVLDVIKQNEAYLPLNYLKGGDISFHPSFDEFGLRCALDMLRKFKPDVFFVHLSPIDTARHRYGVFSNHILPEIEHMDMWLGMIMRTLEDVGLDECTNLVLMSDHGQMDCDRVLNPNVALVKANLIRLNAHGNITDWDAYCESAGFSAHVFLRDGQSASVYERTLEALRPLTQNGVSRILTRDQAKNEYHLDGDFSFVLETDGHTAFSSACRGEQLTESARPTGKHGYMPEKGPQPIFRAKGPNFKSGVTLEDCALVDIAPTLAMLLGGTMPFTQGKPLTDLLKFSAT